MTSCTVVEGESGDGRNRTVRISGEVCFCNDGELQQELYQALHGCDCLELECHGLTRIDHSLVMLICSTHRTAEMLNKRFILRVGPWGMVDVRHAPLQLPRQRGCLFDGSRKCRFWRLLSAPFFVGKGGARGGRLPFGGSSPGATS